MDNISRERNQDSTKTFFKKDEENPSALISQNGQGEEEFREYELKSEQQKKDDEFEKYEYESESEQEKARDRFREFVFESAEEESEDSYEIEYSPLTIPELFEKILSYVDTPSLLSCRLVSRRWCEITSVILQRRPETEMEFHFERYHGYSKHPKKSENRRENSLHRFVQCFKKSRNWPFYRLSFVDTSSVLYTSATKQVFEDSDWIAFLSNFDMSRMKCLKMRFLAVNHYDGSLEILLDTVRGLLLHKTPHLEEFGLFIAYRAGAPETKLFLQLPTTETDPIRLPNLKVIHFDDHMFQIFPEISKDLLNAGVNLRRIHLHHEQFHGLGCFPETFEILSSLGKIHLLKQQQ